MFKFHRQKNKSPKNKSSKDGDANSIDEPPSSENQYQDPPPAPLPRTPSLPPPKPYGVFGTPWRSLEWSKRKNMRGKLRIFEISSPSVKCIRILIHGEVGAGKSSLINSIDSIFQDRMTSGAIAASANNDCSFTKIFQTHKIRNQNYKDFVPFAFCDIMGLENKHSEGAATEDLKNILAGHIRDGYTFNPISPCSKGDRHYNPRPELSDKIHCLVSVVSAKQVTIMDDAIFNKMKDVREQATKLGIPQVTVLTKVDETCPVVATDLKLVYRSKKIKEKMQECSNRLGIPMNYIFPVKCYNEEIHLNDDVDVLLLSALENILNFANDHIAVMAPPPANMRHHYMNDWQ